MWDTITFQQSFDQLVGSFFLKKCPENLKASMLYSLTGEAKRIRPRLFCMVAEMLLLKKEDVFCVAMAIELIHTFTLIHDDLPCMDNSDYRRKKLSNHKKFSESLALLAGDGLLVLGCEVFLQAKVPAPLLLEGMRYLLQQVGVGGVIGGQAAEELLKEKADFEAVLKMHQKKTGALFKASIEIPALFAQCSLEQKQCMQDLAEGIGAAFQIIDDLEDQDEGPVSILSYLSVKEAVQYGVKSLEKAKKSIAAWQSDPLRALLKGLEQQLSDFV